MINSTKSLRTFRTWTHLPWKLYPKLQWCCDVFPQQRWLVNHCQTWEGVSKFWGQHYENTLEFTFVVFPAGQFAPLKIFRSLEPVGINDEVQLSCFRVSCTDGTIQISMVPQRSPRGPEKKSEGLFCVCTWPDDVCTVSSPASVWKVFSRFVNPL